MTIFSLSLGTLLLAAAIWMRRGSPKARFWTRVDGFIDERFVLIFLPAVAFVFLGWGLVGFAWWTLPSGIFQLSLRWFGEILGYLGLAGAIWGVAPIPYPNWFRPVWLRAKKTDPAED